MQVSRVVEDLKALWQGEAYDTVGKNCNHFCEELAAKLEVQPLPGNRTCFVTTAHALQLMKNDIQAARLKWSSQALHHCI